MVGATTGLVVTFVALGASADPPASSGPSVGLVGRATLRWGTQAGGGFSFAVDGYHWWRTHVALGVFVEFTPEDINTESECFYGGKCYNIMFQVGPFLEVHGAPAFVIDPWARLALSGLYAFGPSHRLGGVGADNEGKGFGFAITPAIGFDLHFGKVVLGPYLGFSGVVGPNQSSLDMGARLGAHW